MKKTFTISSVCVFFLILWNSAYCNLAADSVRPKLTIISALFGLGNTWADYTKQISARVKDDYLYLHVNLIWQEIGDPLPGADKYLKLQYKLGDKVYNEEKMEGDVFMINLPPPNLECRAKLLKAEWGLRNRKVIDVTQKLKEHIIICSLDFEVFAGPKIFGDPLPGASKQLYLEYIDSSGKAVSKTYNEEGYNSRVRLNFPSNITSNLNDIFRVESATNIFANSKGQNSLFTLSGKRIVNRSSCNCKQQMEVVITSTAQKKIVLRTR